MRIYQQLFVAGMILTGVSFALGQEPDMNFVGKKILIRYESGLQVIGHYKSTNEMSWEALSGPSKGEKGTETIYSAEVAPNVYFVNWVEEKGITVSQVIDLNASKITAFVTFDTGTRRQSLLDKGTFSEQP